MKVKEIRQLSGKRLRLIRQMIGASQDAFSKSIFISQATLHHYESGKRTISLETANVLRRQYKITTDWLYYGDDDAMASGTVRRLRSASEKSGIPYLGKSLDDPLVVDDGQEVSSEFVDGLLFFLGCFHEIAPDQTKGIIKGFLTMVDEKNNKTS